MTGVETLPCGHATEDSLFEVKGGARVLITLPPQHGDWGVVPGAVWCVDDFSWQTCTGEQYEVYKAVSA